MNVGGGMLSRRATAPVEHLDCDVALAFFLHRMRRALENNEDRFCSLHDFSRETFMQRKLNVACATLCNITLALAYSV